MPSEQIPAYTVSVGTAVVPIVGMSADAQNVLVQNLEPSSHPDSYARAGYLYIVGGTVTIAGDGTALFNIATGSAGLQIEGYELVSTEHPVYAELVEGATVTTTGAAIPSYNLNRTENDNATAVLTAASTVSGGSAISSELITASKQGGGGAMIVSKIHTLEPSSDYAFRFTNISNQATVLFFQVIFSEKFNGQNDLWVGGTVGDGYRIRGGESVQLPMIQGQILSAVAEEAVEVGVLRQD
jgi:hypothetical protein